MKTIVEQNLGGDGGKVGVYVGEGKLKVEASYPLEKIVSPATNAFNSAMDKLEKAIPGDWDKPMIEKIKSEFQAELIKQIGE